MSTKTYDREHFVVAVSAADLGDADTRKELGINDAAVMRDLAISDRMGRSYGRAARRMVASTKVTKQEHDEFDKAAKRLGKVLSEWAREVLLREARQSPTDQALFTELMAIRLLLNAALRPLVLHESMTREQYGQLLAEVKRTKHDIASDVLAQYQTTTGGK
jgi:hypothetical protein